MNPLIGDYGFVVINGDLKAREDHCKPDNCDQGMRTLVEIQAGSRNRQRSLNLKLLFAWSLSHIGVVRHEEQTQ